MRGLRVFQALRLKKVSEEIDEIFSEVYKELEKRETYWSFVDHDWYDVSTGEALTNYKPSERADNIIKNIKNKPNEQDKIKYLTKIKERNYSRNKKFVKKL